MRITSTDTHTIDMDPAQVITLSWVWRLTDLKLHDKWGRAFVQVIHETKSGGANVTLSWVRHPRTIDEPWLIGVRGCGWLSRKLPSGRWFRNRQAAEKAYKAVLLDIEHHKKSSPVRRVVSITLKWAFLVILIILMFAIGLAAAWQQSLGDAL
jgi:hypothetical protein